MLKYNSISFNRVGTISLNCPSFTLVENTTLIYLILLASHQVISSLHMVVETYSLHVLDKFQNGALFILRRFPSI